MAPRILLVEDESITRAYLADVLRNDGYEVKEARDGAEGVALFEHEHFDVVITDLVMPQLNGFKLTARVRSISPETPVILVTAYLSGQSGKVIVEGEAEFIGKPIEPEILLATLKHLLGDLPSASTIYRREHGCETWHFRSDCSNWPIDNYAEQDTELAPGPLCNECKSKEANPAP
jgi:two-component system cell cycle response regulator CpdR